MRNSGGVSSPYYFGSNVSYSSGNGPQIPEEHIAAIMAQQQKIYRQAPPREKTPREWLDSEIDSIRKLAFA